MGPTRIYCADGNRRFAEIALRQGFQYGACMPNTVYFPPYFTDQDWRAFNKADVGRKYALRAAYFDALAKHRPALATVLDFEHPHQYAEVLSWAEQAAPYVTEAIIIIPKVHGGIEWLARDGLRQIGGKEVRLGYAAATTFAGTSVPVNAFAGWPVHCLGGSPAVQMRLARVLDVRSADGNFIQNMARAHCQVFTPGFEARHHGWPTLRELGLSIAHDAPYLAFELTCIGVQMAWEGATGTAIYAAQLAHLRAAGITPQARQLAFL